MRDQPLQHGKALPTVSPRARSTLLEKFVFHLKIQKFMAAPATIWSQSLTIDQVNSRSCSRCAPICVSDDRHAHSPWVPVAIQATKPPRVGQRLKADTQRSVLWRRIPFWRWIPHPFGAVGIGGAAPLTTVHAIDSVHLSGTASAERQ